MAGTRRKKRSCEKEMERVREILGASGRPLSFNQILRAYDERTYKKMSDLRNHLNAALRQLLEQREVEKGEKENGIFYRRS